MEDFSITAIIPVLNRPKNVERLIRSFIDNTPLALSEMLFITNSWCKEEIDEVNRLISVINSGFINIVIAPDDVVSWAKKINWGINYSSTNNNFGKEAPWILCGADDVIFHSNWFEAARKASVGFSGIIGTNELGRPIPEDPIYGHTTHPIASRKYVREQGTLDERGKLLHEGYLHNYVDIELISTAKNRNCWKIAADCIIEHCHPCWQKAEWDDVYQKGQDNWGHDRQLCISRSVKFKFKL